MVSDNIFFSFFPNSILDYVKSGDPRGGGQSLSWCRYSNKLGRGPLEDATYQISKLYAFWFLTRRFFKFSFVLVAMPTRVLNGIILKGVHTRTISFKFVCSWPCGVGGDVV